VPRERSSASAVACAVVGTFEFASRMAAPCLQAAAPRLEAVSRVVLRLWFARWREAIAAMREQEVEAIAEKERQEKQGDRRSRWARSSLLNKTLRWLLCTITRGDAEAAPTSTTAPTEWQETKARLEAELAAKRADAAARDAELKRWRNGELTCKHVIDVDTGAVASTVVEVATTEIGPPNKRARLTEGKPPSTLSLLADWNERAVRVKTEATERASRLTDELEDATLCTVCCENRRDVVFTGCGHFLSCGQCADVLLAAYGGTRDQTEAPCPVCRQRIATVLPCTLA